MASLSRHFTSLKLGVQLSIAKCQRFLTYKNIGAEWPLMYKTVGEVVDEAAEKYGDKTALICVDQNKKLSFVEVKQRSENLAAGMLSLGVTPGDRVGLWAPNSAEWYLASLAMAKAGIISVYLNPAYQADELKHCMQTVGCKMLLAAESFKSIKYNEILDAIDPKIAKSEPGRLESSVLPSLKTIVSISDKEYPGMIPLKVLESKNSGNARKIVKSVLGMFGPDDASNIQFTSGTTGSPKGAVLTHFNIVNNSFLVSRRQKLHTKNHIMCFMGPFFHTLGSVVATLSCLHDGMTLVIPAGAYSATKSAEAIVKEKCTVLLGTPTMYIDIMRVLAEKGLEPQDAEVAISGGAFAATSLFRDMLKKLKLKRISSVYGLTETGPISFMSKVDDTFEQQVGTVGYLMDHFEAMVVDENGKRVPWNTPGELWVRGHGVMKGYWNAEEKTKEAITPDRWFKTGDQFAISEDGYGRVVGRIKDMIIRGGENIYPADVEEFLSIHPDIVEVQVIGVPDERLGEKVCACIRRKVGSNLTEEELKKFCMGKILKFLNISGLSIRFQGPHQEKYKNTSYEIKPWLTSN
ncbi:hypothetical protein RUM43_012118 [Polyplax serrata]|uniref:Medium-chain acyl-CoA ligase ACSF2, mitochondrial n=1 Tax=Polyplax serrata TaxID=468196 RepID=A0AAN8NZ81_POLSC